MNRQNFIVLMSFLNSYLGASPDNKKLDIYWDCMSHLSDDQFSNAVKNIIKEFIPSSTVPFPLVAHFLKYTGQNTQGESTNALALLAVAKQKIGCYDSVCFLDPALHHVIRTMGGWTAVCSMTDKEWDINAGRMKQIYETAQLSNTEAPDHLTGLTENECGWFNFYIIPPTGYQNKIRVRCKGEIPLELKEKISRKIKSVCSINNSALLKSNV